MNELTTTRTNYISIKAACSTQEQTLLAKITEEVFKCAQYRGQVITQEDAAIAAGFFLEDLQEDYDGLDTIEIAPILRRGVRGEYGDYYGLNAATFRKWVQAYLASDERQAYKKAKSEARALLAEKHTKSESEIDEQCWQTLCSQYETYLAYQRGNYTSVNNLYFNPAGTHIGEPLWDRNGIRLALLKAHGYDGESVKDVFDRAIKQGLIKLQ